MKEIWKDVVGYEGLYQVSNQGNVKSLNYLHTKQERLRKLVLDKDGYLFVILHKDGKRKKYQVHRLVAQTFIENIGNKPCIDHINAIKTDNRIENLRWSTYKENNNNPITKERYRIATNKARKVFCESTMYDSVKQCAEYYNVKRTTMSGWLTGRNQMPIDFQAKGLKYYIEE